MCTQFSCSNQFLYVSDETQCADGTASQAAISEDSRTTVLGVPPVQQHT